MSSYSPNSRPPLSPSRMSPIGQSEKPLVEGIDLPDGQDRELGLILRVAFQEFRARYAVYSYTQARQLAIEARRRRSSSARWPDGSTNSQSKVEYSHDASNRPQTWGERPWAPLPATTHEPTDLADALLHDDPRPGYAGPGIVWLDGEGTLGLARELPGMLFCLKIYYVSEVDPLWNIPLKVVPKLKGWLHRQFLAAQGITPMPRLNPRAVTTLAQVWELLAQFDANVQHKATFIRATPRELGSKKPIVEASVTFQARPAQVATTSQEVGVIAQDVLADDSKHAVGTEGQKRLSSERRLSCHDVSSENMELSLQCKIQAQQAEIARLMKSIATYSTRIRSANRDIRSLQKELRDSQTLNGELQHKYNMAKQRAGGMAHEPIGVESLTTDLTTISADSIQQASDLSDQILSAAAKLVAAVEANAVIRPGFTERTLQDLQVMVDMLVETTQDIKDEPACGVQDGKGKDFGNDRGDNSECNSNDDNETEDANNDDNDLEVEVDDPEGDKISKTDEQQTDIA